MENYKCKKLYEKCRKFRTRFFGISVHSKQTVHKMLYTFRTTGLIFNKTRQTTRRVLSDETLYDTWERKEASSRKILKWLPQETGVSSHLYTQPQNYVPWNYTNLNVQKLEEADSAARVRLCNWFNGAVCNGVINPMLTYCAHDGWYYFNDHVNTQNSR